MTVHVVPALLGADPLNLAAAIDDIEHSDAPYLHLDVMDGHYTGDITFGLRTIGAIRAHTSSQLDIHLQTLHPERYVDDLVRIGVDRVSMHVDAATHIDVALDALQTAGVRKGLVLNPEVPIEQLDPYLSRLDFIILMTSKPGTSTYDPTVTTKIHTLRTRLTNHYLDTVELIADGGITTRTAPEVIAAGIDTLVAASAIFKTEDTNISDAMKRLAQSGDSAASVTKS